MRDMSGKNCWDFTIIFRMEEHLYKFNEKDTKRLISEGKREDIEEEMEENEIEKKENENIETKTNTNEIEFDNEKKKKKKRRDDDKEEEKNFPNYQIDIDTDKTDMLNLLQHYIHEIFPECIDFSDGVLNSIKEQNFDIQEIIESRKIDEDILIKLKDLTKDRPMVDITHPLKKNENLDTFKPIR
jgi:hypothetical protein